MTTIQISGADISVLKQIEEYVRKLQIKTPLKIVRFQELDDTNDADAEEFFWNQLTPEEIAQLEQIEQEETIPFESLRKAL